MKLLILSDTHGYLGYAEDVIDRIGDKMEGIIHLGDHDRDAMALQAKYYNKKVYFIKGNNDGSSDTPYEEMLTLAGKKILITHGHRQQVYWSLNAIGYWADEHDADIVLFGHTHTPVIDYSGNIMIFNPGSISLPRTTKNPTFGIIDISDSGIVEGTIMEYISKTEFIRAMF